MASRGLFAIMLGVVALGAPAAGAAPHTIGFHPATREPFDDARSVAVARVVGSDARADVVVTGEHSLRVYRQSDDGKLGEPREWPLPGVEYPYHAHAVETGDLDRDGHLDVVVGVHDGVVVYGGTGQTLVAPTLISDPGAGYPRIADFDLDGRNDIAVSSYNGLDVLWNTGAGFTLETVAGRDDYYDVATQLDVGDLNGDGRPDIAGCGGPQCKTLRVFTAAPGRSFERTDHTIVLPETQCSSIGDVAVGDLNGDGRDDAVALGLGCSEAIMVFLQQDDGTIEQDGTYFLGPQLGDALAIGDMNGDELMDVVVVHGPDDRRPVSFFGVFRQLPDHRFARERITAYPWWQTHESSGVAIGDLDSSGRLDLVSADWEYGLVVLRQLGPPKGVVRLGGPQTLTRMRLRGIHLGVGTDQPGRVRFQIGVAPATARRLGIRRPVFGRREIVEKANDARPATIWIPARIARKLKRLDRAAFLVTGRAYDLAGSSRPFRTTLVSSRPN